MEKETILGELTRHKFYDLESKALFFEDNSIVYSEDDGKIWLYDYDELSDADSPLFTIEQQAQLVFVQIDEGNHNNKTQTKPVDVSLDMVLSSLFLLEYIDNQPLRDILEQLARLCESKTKLGQYEPARQKLYKQLECFRINVPTSPNKSPILVEIHPPWRKRSLPHQYVMDCLYLWYSKAYRTIVTKLNAYFPPEGFSSEDCLQDTLTSFVTLWAEWAEMLFMTDETDMILTKWLASKITCEHHWNEVFSVMNGRAGEAGDILYRCVKNLHMTDLAFMELSQTSFDILGRMFASMPSKQRCLSVYPNSKTTDIVLAWFVVEQMFLNFEPYERDTCLSRMRFVLSANVAFNCRVQHFLNFGQAPIFKHANNSFHTASSSSNSEGFLDMIQYGWYLPARARYVLCSYNISDLLWILKEARTSRSVLIECMSPIITNKKLVHWQLLKDSIHAFDRAMFDDDDDDVVVDTTNDFFIRITTQMPVSDKQYQIGNYVWEHISSKHVHVSWDMDEEQHAVQKLIRMTAFAIFETFDDWMLWKRIVLFWKQIIIPVLFHREQLSVHLDEHLELIMKTMQKQTTPKTFTTKSVNTFLYTYFKKHIPEEILSFSNWAPTEKTEFKLIQDALSTKTSWSEYAMDRRRNKGSEQVSVFISSKE